MYLVCHQDFSFIAKPTKLTTNEENTDLEEFILIMMSFPCKKVLCDM